MSNALHIHQATGEGQPQVHAAGHQPTREVLMELNLVLSSRRS
jgi:hypothetical protein